MVNKTDVVFTFSVEVLDDAIHREYCRPPDQSLLALARDDRVGSLLVADPWRSALVDVVKRRPLNLCEPIEVAERAAVRVRPRRLRRKEATRLSTVERAYRAYGASLGRALARIRREREARPHSAALVTFHPFVAAFCVAPWISNVVFVARDDWTSGVLQRPWWALYEQAYRRMDERKAVMFAVSTELATRISRNVTVVPNGVNSELWNPRRTEPKQMMSLPRPRAVYAGTLDERVDLTLIKETANSVGSLVMVGWKTSSSVAHELESIKNVHLFEPVGQQELAAILMSCDVGVLPHHDTRLTRAMSPLKLYEYLAAGLPVVAVDLPPVRGVHDDVMICAHPEQWRTLLQQAITRGHAEEDKRLEFISEVSWEKRTRPIVDAAVDNRLKSLHKRTAGLPASPSTRT